MADVPAPDATNGTIRSPNEAVRRLIVALMVPIPWALLLFQLVVIVPRYAKLFAEFGLKLPDLTQFWIDVSHWVNEHPVPALGLFAVAVLGSVLGAHRAYGPTANGNRRWWLLFLIYAVPTLAFITVWLGVDGPHAKLEEGLRR